MATYDFHIVQRHTLRRQELMLDLMEMFADDMQARAWQQVMDVGHTPGTGVVDWDHCELGVVRDHRAKGILERRARQCFVSRENRSAGHVGVSTRDALKGYFFLRHLLVSQFADDKGLVTPKSPGTRASRAGRKHLPGALQVGGSIDTQWYGVNAGDAKPHASFQGP